MACPLQEWLRQVPAQRQVWAAGIRLARPVRDPPSERTFRRVLADLDGDALDKALCRYAADVTRGQAPTLVIPRDGGTGRTLTTAHHGTRR